VILVSASRRAARAAPSELGVAAVIAKPFDLEQLLETIRRAVDDSRP
jgi:AmiR/NasT family two-component response regulator